ncbi:MAG: hypothetical protein V1866_06730 [archaeon]
MVGVVEGAAYIGSAVVLYHGITKQKVLSNDNIRNGTLGALLGLYLGPKLEEIIRKDKTISEDDKKKIFGTIAGAFAGGGLAYYAISHGAAGYLKDQIKGYVDKNKPGTQQQ